MKRKFLSEIEGLEVYKAYSVTSDGRIFSHYKRHDHEWEILKNPVRELKHAISRKGYHEIRIGNGENKKSLRVHRLVAMAFIPNPKNKPQVNHIDGNKDNNDASNLEWCNNKENHKHKLEHGLNVAPSGDAHYMHVRRYKKDEFPCCKEILQFDKSGNLIAEYPSVKTAGEVLNIDRTTISKVLKGRKKTAGGYVWKYKTEGSTTIENQEEK